MERRYRNFYTIIKSVNPEVIFEFGSWNGEDSLMFRKIFPESEIYAFEPDKRSYEITKPLFDKANINFFNIAITDKTGTSELYFSDLKDGTPGPAASILPFTEYHKHRARDFIDIYDETMPINTTTINDFCKKHSVSNIDFMQIDVDGAVHHVLKGFGDIRPKLIYAEVNEIHNLYMGAKTEKEYDFIFRDMGYELILVDAANSFYKLKS
ncbi:MAG: FkbM family methyltransferase [Candidatus Hodarchaeales archaeon]